MSLVTYLDSAFGHITHGTEASRWAGSGAMALTGDADGAPLAPAAPVAGVMAAAGALLSELAPGAVADAPALLGERAALLGLTRAGRVSCGGATRLLPGSDGWLAVALARPDDWGSVEAWLGCEPNWDAVTAAVARLPAEETAERGWLLGLPVSIVSDGAAPTAPSPWRISPGGCLGQRREGPALVVDLSALWAGPLCGDLWCRSGATVVKVEDPARPDGARRGHPGFFALLNGAKRPLSAPIDSPELRRLVADADVVITSGRRRAFDHAGLDVDAVLTASPTVWIAITAHGWSGDAADRVGFGDDTAAGAGLVATHPVGGAPRFVADAVADPLCGTLAAVAGLAARAAGGSWLIDASLSGAARYAVGRGTDGPAVPADADGRGGWSVGGETVRAPRARAVR